MVVLHESERSPAGADVHFVRGDTTSAADLERAGIPDAAAAITCPSDGTNEADMRSILTVLAIETMAPQVRTVVEVNNPKHVEHLRRAHADEILVTSRLASRLRREHNATLLAVSREGRTLVNPVGLPPVGR